MSRPYWVVGAGRMGLSVAEVVVRADVADSLHILGRRPGPPDHPVFEFERTRYRSDYPPAPAAETLVIIAVPDGHVAAVADQLAGLGEPGPGCIALHLSGALSSSVLVALRERGYATGSLHPLQTVADPRDGWKRLRDAFFTFEGSNSARAAAIEIVEAATGKMLEVHAADKGRYHAACVFASNYMVACAGVATSLLAAATGIAEEDAARALRPLWRGAVANLEDWSPANALTGPVRRGDAETVKANLAGLDEVTRELYSALALQALELSKRAGLSAEKAAAIEATIVRAGRRGAR